MTDEYKSENKIERRIILKSKFYEDESFQNRNRQQKL